MTELVVLIGINVCLVAMIVLVALKSDPGRPSEGLVRPADPDPHLPQPDGLPRLHSVLRRRSAGKRVTFDASWVQGDDELEIQFSPNRRVIFGQEDADGDRLINLGGRLGEEGTNWYV